MAVRCLRRQIAISLETGGVLLLIADDVFIALAQLLVGIDVQTSLIAVDHHFGVIEGGHRQLAHPDHRRNAERARDDGHMRIARSLHRADAGDLLERLFDQHRGRNLLADQDGVVLDGELTHVLLFLQLRQDTQAEILDIGHALAQIGVIHGLEGLHVLADDLAQRPLRPVAGTDAGDDLTDQAMIVEHAQIDLEQRPLLGHQARRHLAIEFLNRDAHRR